MQVNSSDLNLMATLALYLTKTRQNITWREGLFCFAPKKETKHFELFAIAPRSLAVN